MRKITNYLTVSILSFLGCLFLLNTALAYVWDGYKWETYTVGYHINDTWAGLYGTNAITNSAQTWNNAGFGFNLSYLGMTTLNVFADDGQNIIGFQNDGDTNYIAWALSSVAPGSKQITDTDTYFNNYYPFSNNGDSCCYDIQHVMTHEFGHWLMLRHTQDSNCDFLVPWSSRPTMCAGGGSHGRTEFRTLEQDDVNGINHIYPTLLNGSILTDTILVKERSPYIISGSVVIPAGVTLILDPGVIFKFRPGARFIVNGILEVNGLSTDKVYFTSIKDDTVGGDTNSDGSATSPADQDWSYIQFGTGSVGNINHVVVRYGGTPYLIDNTVCFCVIYQSGGTTSISNSEFSNNAYGIRIIGGSSEIFGSTIYTHTPDLGRYCNQLSFCGAYVAENAFLTFNNNTIINDSLDWPIVVYSPMNFNHSGNIVSGSGKKGFYHLYGEVSSDLVWDDNPVYVINRTDISEGKTLTINQGVVVKFAGRDSLLMVNGTLQVNGTSDDKVYFTSLDDDSAGGDTNSDGSASIPFRERWSHIQFNAGSAGNINHAVVRYGGSGTRGLINNYNQFDGEITISNSEFSNGYSGIGLSGGATTISNSKFYDNLYGLYQSDGETTIYDSEFSNNIYGLFVRNDEQNDILNIYNSVIRDNQYGIELVNDTTNLSTDIRMNSFIDNSCFGLGGGSEQIDARDNWWGHALGPTQVINSNNQCESPAILGDKVLNVDYVPWLTSDPN